jgi:subtilisin family serine protease
VFVGAYQEGDGFPTSIPGVIAAAGSESAIPPGALAAPARHVLTLRPRAQYDFESGNSVAAAEITAVIALLMSATPARLSAANLTLLLQPAVTATAAPDPPASIDAAAALARLDRGALRGCLAPRSGAPQPPACTALASHALDGR